MSARAQRGVTRAALLLLIGGCFDAVPGLLPLSGDQRRALEPEPAQFLKEDELPVTPQPVGEPIFGAADYHMHQFADIGFGGRVLHGASYHPDGIARALTACGPRGACLDERLWMLCREVRCRLDSDKAACRAACDRNRCGRDTDHGHLGFQDAVGAALAESYLHQVSGYPDFVGWPHYNTYTHQQIYHRWLRRAFDGGLKLIVMHAVTNEVLCKFLDHGRGADCDDMANVDEQLKAAWRFERWVDEENDGEKNGNGWYRIATSPARAREIIADGALAVVLGIEVDTLFKCSRDRENCDIQEVQADIEHYVSGGVRHVFPVHLFDNAFGGTAAASDLFNWGSAVINEKEIQVYDCADEGYEFRYGDETPQVGRALGAMSAFFGVSLPKWPSGPAAAGGNALRAMTEAGLAAPPRGAGMKAHCNCDGLYPLGDQAVLAMMQAKLILDVDHMSHRSRARLYEIAEGCNYPGLVSGHSGFASLYRSEKKHEGQLTEEELARHLGLGGLVAPLLNEGDLDTVLTYARPERHGPGVANDCAHSAKSFAQAYLYSVDRMRDAVNEGRSGGMDVVGVGFGSDLNGLAGMPAPRFGPYACAGDGAPQARHVDYPFELFGDFGPKMHRMQAGYRVFDIDVDGYANAGMFPDFVAELREVGLRDQDLEPLFSSAEAYIRLWERVAASGDACTETKLPPRSEGRAPPGCKPSPH